MNRLSTERQAQVVRCLVEGSSIRATVRMTGVAKNTVTKLLADLGAACSEYQDAAITGIRSVSLQADEIWSYCYAKQKNVPDEFEGTFGYGDVWTWVGLDADSKLAISWLVGERTDEDADVFLRDLASRVVGHPQITTDAFGAYTRHVVAAFGPDVDFAQQRKEVLPDYTERRYSPPRYRVVETIVQNGAPDEDYISTSYVERQNLTMRMGMRRFTRLTNGFSKKVENLAHAVSLHFMHYNFCRAHQTLTQVMGHKTTPAMAAGIADHIWSVEELCELLQANPDASEGQT